MGIVLWFTGLSGSGKTTLALALKEELESHNKNVFILDGDAVRGAYTRPLGFSREDLRENNRIFIELAKEKSSTHDIVLIPKISPRREDREVARQALDANFIEVFVDCPLSVCENRDVKGLYKKARAGEIKDMIGVSEESPYEAPENPDIVIHTGDRAEEESLQTLLRELRSRGLV